MAAGTSMTGNQASDAWIGFYRGGKHRLKRAYNAWTLTSAQRFFHARLVEEIERALASGIPVVRALSLGSGIDHMSARLARQYGNRVSITVVDISAECIEENRRLFGSGLQYECADIFEYRPDEPFHLVYNTGLLEHFSVEEQRQILSVIHDHLEPNGRYVTLNPSQAGKVYVSQMKKAMANGTWPFGPEVPLTSLSSLTTAGMTLTEERRCCSLFQLRFCLLNSKASYALAPVLFLDDLGVLRFAEPFAQRFLGTYGLFSIVEKVGRT